MNVTTQCDDRFSRTKFDFAGTYKMGGGGLLGRDHSACENGNSPRFPGTRRSTSSGLVRTSRKRQCFGSAVDFYLCYTNYRMKGKVKLGVNSAANYYENQFFSERPLTHIYFKSSCPLCGCHGRLSATNNFIPFPFTPQYQYAANCKWHHK